MGFINRHRRPASYPLFGKPKRVRTNKTITPINLSSIQENRPRFLILFACSFIVVILIFISTSNRISKVMRDKTPGEMSASEYATYLEEDKQGVTLRFADPVEKARYIKESQVLMGNLRGAEYRLKNISSIESMKVRQDRYEDALDALKKFNINYRTPAETTKKESELVKPKSLTHD